MTNIKKLGNKQLEIYYERIYHHIYDIQDNILEDIYNILWKEANINEEQQQNIEKFMIFFKKYESAISIENKKILQTFIEQKNSIEKEMSIRQYTLLKTIGIQVPSIRTEIIIKETWGELFWVFDNMIHYIQLAKKGKEKKRPQKKNISVPEKLKNILKKLWTDRKNTLLTNEWPLPN